LPELLGSFTRAAKAIAGEARGQGNTNSPGTVGYTPTESANWHSDMKSTQP
jgi:hypothetical protein